MSKNTLGRDIEAANARAQYDEAVKRLLANKQILARILGHTVDEFAGMPYPDIVKCIDTPEISSVPVDPGLTHGYVQTLNTESKIPGEGYKSYDIRFVARLPKKRKKNGIEINLIIDIEAQKDPNPGYNLVTRGIYYCGRMLSEQDGVTFTGSHYDNILKVYSIWIVMNCPAKSANTVSAYRIVHEAKEGEYVDDTRYDLMQVIMIRLPKDDKGAKNEPTELHSMLTDLLGPDDARVKEEKLKRYGLSTESMEGEMNSMCNLSELVEERGIEKGIEKGRTQGLKQGRKEFLVKIKELVTDGILTAEEATARFSLTKAEAKSLTK